MRRQFDRVVGVGEEGEDPQYCEAEIHIECDKCASRHYPELPADIEAWEQIITEIIAKIGDRETAKRRRKIIDSITKNKQS